jgi:4-amino-4-deoxy-L-arabinose transferase-like glycosyltransferase
MDSRNGVPRLALLTFLAFLAFSLYTFRLDYQSLWYDEGFSVYLARMSLGEITARTAHDIHPPFYYYLLHFWIPIFGSAEFALRFLSLIFGVLTVPLIYGVGNRLLGSASGLLTATLISISPLFLWYSQEARMYTLVTFLCLLSTYLLLRATGSQGKRAIIWTGYALSNLVAVYTHFYAFFVVAFQALFLLGWWAFWSRGRVRQRWPTLVSGLICQLAVLGGYLPWSGFVLQRYGADVSYWAGTLRVSEVLRKTLIMFSTGHSVLEVIAQPIAVGYLLLLLVALVVLVLEAVRVATPSGEDSATSPLVHRLPWLTLSSLLLYLGLPCLLLLVISYQRAKFHPRYLMLASPAFFLLISGGIVGMLAAARRRFGQWRTWASIPAYLFLAFIVLTSLYGVFNAYFDISFLKDDFRSAVRYIEDQKRGNEVVILTSGHFFPVFTYYYHQDDWYPIPDEPTLSAEHVLNFSLADELNRILPGRDGVWLLLWQHEVVDPVGFLTMMLDDQGTLVPYRGGFWGLKLLHYALPPDAHFLNEPRAEQPLAVNFDGQVRLLGHTVPQGKATTRNLEVILYWEALQVLEDDYKVSVRLRDEAGHEWGGLDGRPVGELYPSFRWLPGEKLFGQLVVVPDVATPPGEYQLMVSLYSDVNLVGLDVLDADGTPMGTTASLGSVELSQGRAASLAEIEPSHSMQADFGQGLELVGYELSTYEGQPGDTLQLSLYWHAVSRLSGDFVFLLQLYDEGGNLIDEGISGPEVAAWSEPAGAAPHGQAYHLANRRYPTSLWRAGDVVRGQYGYRLPLQASPGLGELRATLLQCLDGLMLVSYETLATQSYGGEIIIAFGGSAGDQEQVLVCRGEAAPSQAAIAPLQIEATERVFSPPEVQHRVDGGNLGSKALLYGYDLSADVVHPGDTLYLTLHWQALDTMETSYTVFTHLLDVQNQVRGQMDSLPQGGARPTTGWVPQEYIRDEYQLVVQPDAPPGEYVIEAGMYDASTPDFQRLPLQDVEGNVMDDRIVLDVRIRVEAP